jgi:hypothetical protein
MDDSGFPRTPDRLPELSSSRVQQSEVFRTMIGARGLYNSGGSATPMYEAAATMWA